MAPKQRIIILNLIIAAVSGAVSFLWWPIGVGLFISGSIFINVMYFIIKRQYQKYEEMNAKFVEDAKARGEEVTELTQHEFDLLMKNHVVTKNNKTIFMEDIKNGNKEG